VGGLPKKSVSGNSLRPRRGGPAESHREYYVGEGFLGKTPPPRTEVEPTNGAAARAAQSLRGLTVSPAAGLPSTGPKRTSESRRRASGRRDPLSRFELVSP
jgi:hypothetical protein